MNCITRTVLLLAAVSAATLQSAEQQVTRRDAEVAKNNVIDSAGEDLAQPDRVISLAGGTIEIISKTFAPPGGHLFKAFPAGGFVDISNIEPGTVSVEPVAQSETQITVKGIFIQNTAADFPLRAEGNLKKPVEGGAAGQSTPPVMHWAAKTMKIKVDLAIYHGDNGTMLAEDDEESLGAFTVPNMNDSNGNGTPDNDDGTVPNDPDLMRLDILAPVPNLGDSLTLSLVSGAVKVWETSSKGTLVTLPKLYPVSELPKTVWVEANQTSATLRDIALKIEYKGAADVVNATAVRVTLSPFRGDNSQGQQRDPLDNPENPMYQGGLGLTPTSANATHTVNVNQMELRGIISPSAASQVSILQFDFKRIVEAKIWVKKLDDALWTLKEQKPDGTTDDASNDDEDLHDGNGFIWTTDAPGAILVRKQLDYDLYTHQQTFVETAHLLINKADNTVSPGSGLVASDPFPWHSFLTLRYRSEVQGYVRYLATGEKNEIRPGAAVLGIQP